MRVAGSRGEPLDNQRGRAGAAGSPFASKGAVWRCQCCSAHLRRCRGCAGWCLCIPFASFRQNQMTPERFQDECMQCRCWKGACMQARCTVRCRSCKPARRRAQVLPALHSWLLRLPATGHPPPPCCNSPSQVSSPLHMAADCQPRIIGLQLQSIYAMHRRPA